MSAVATPSLPVFRDVLAEVVIAERAEGWLARCAATGTYLVVTRELVHALVGVIERLGAPPVLEVCAGDGTLARALAELGVSVTATDAHPARGSRVTACPAAASLRRYPHPMVLGSFVPFDAGIEERILAAGHVRHYLALGARIGVHGGVTNRLGAVPGWDAVPLPGVARWMVTRHDAWLGDGSSIRCRGEAWLLSRTQEVGP
ncbi:MAG: hypothetical protein R3314_00080 [Longimicrobiales bacterium]|nr:hypothetical protein [Longimicrobiales bacterium]